MEYRTEIVREGAAELEVPLVPRRRGPGSRTVLPFYNPTMEINRDVTVAVASALPPNGPFLDGLAATGATGIRVALEAGVREVILNDANPLAADLAARNAARNHVNARMSRRKLQDLLTEERFAHVDVDPFGSPIPYVDAAVRAVTGGGCLSVTATDVSTLGGVHPAAALRRYGVRLARSTAIPEVAVRALAGVLARAAADHEAGVVPICAFAAEHFVRVHLEVRARASAADAALAWLGSATVPGGLRDVSIGPLWLGPLGTETALRAMVDRAPSAAATRLLATLEAELGLPPFYLRTEDVAGLVHGAPPSISKVIANLRERGFRAERTHFDRTGLKSNAPPTEVVRAIRELSERTAGP